MKRILVIAGGLQVGGAERVAANIALYDTHKEFEFHYLVFKGLDNIYGAEIEEHGGKIFTIPSPSDNYFMYIRSLVKLMKEYKYSVVHSHTMFNSGINLLIAKIMGVPCRIAHSHTTKTECKVSLKQKIYEWLMKKIIQYTASEFLACGNEAGQWLFSKKLFCQRGMVIKNGINIDKFIFSTKNRNEIRTKLGVEEKFVIGHSGSIIPLKNQIFLINLLPEILKLNNNAVLILIGGGNKDNIEELRKRIHELKLEDKVIFCGCINNVNEYLSAIDVFVFPSKREGTPLALIEAQTNGLPCIISDTIPDDVKVTDLITKISLEYKEGWIHAICNSKRNINVDYCKQIEKLGFNTKESIQKIYSIYRGA